jgi:hypothetical protein
MHHRSIDSHHISIFNACPWLQERRHNHSLFHHSQSHSAGAAGGASSAPAGPSTNGNGGSGTAADVEAGVSIAGGAIVGGVSNLLDLVRALRRVNTTEMSGREVRREADLPPEAGKISRRALNL